MVMVNAQNEARGFTKMEGGSTKKVIEHRGFIETLDSYNEIMDFTVVTPAVFMYVNCSSSAEAEICNRKGE